MSFPNLSRGVRHPKLAQALDDPIISRAQPVRREISLARAIAVALLIGKIGEHQGGRFVRMELDRLERIGVRAIVLAEI